MFNHQDGEHLLLDTARIYFEVQGDSAAPPLLFLHGGLGTMRDFNGMLPLLRRNFRLIGIDSRGQGKSTLGTAGLTYERLQRDAIGVLAHLGVKRYSAVGFSDGGITALRMAAAGGSGMDKLVAIGADMSHPEPKVRDILGGVTAESWTQKFPETVQLYQSVNPEPDFAALIEAVVPMWLDDSGSGYPGKDVSRIQCALLAVRGDDDPLVSRASVFELVQRVPKAKLLSIPFAGHEAHKDQAELLMLSVNQFLA